MDYRGEGVKTKGKKRNAQRIGLTLPDHIRKHIQKIARARGLPTATYLSQFVTESFSNDKGMRKQEIERHAKAIVALDAKQKMEGKLSQIIESVRKRLK